MKRLVYSPRVDVFVKSDSGVVDLSPYVTSCTVNRKVNQISSATVNFRNPKFIFTNHEFTDDRGNTTTEPMFHPMDPIIITMSRLKDRPIQVFTGYCDTTPYLALYPGVVTIEASCTLKRLLYKYWDPGLPFVWDFLTQHGFAPNPQLGGVANTSAETTKLGKQDRVLTDGSLGNLLFALLEEIGGWDPESIYIEELPKGVVKAVGHLYDEMKSELEADTGGFEDFVKKLLGSVSYGGGGGNVGSGPDVKSGVKGKVLTKDDLIKVAKAHNFPDPNMAAAIALAESSGIVANRGGPNTDGSFDHGLWQINDKAHPNYDIDKLESDVDYNANAAYEISSGGTNWVPWSTFNNGDYKAHL